MTSFDSGIALSANTNDGDVRKIMQACFFARTCLRLLPNQLARERVDIVCFPSSQLKQDASRLSTSEKAAFFFESPYGVRCRLAFSLSFYHDLPSLFFLFFSFRDSVLFISRRLTRSTVLLLRENVDVVSSLANTMFYIYLSEQLELSQIRFYEGS